MFFGLSVVGMLVSRARRDGQRRNDAGHANAQVVAQNEARAVLADPELLVADAGSNT